MIEIYNEDCIIGAQKHINDSSIDLIICDPPFGIGEKDFSKHYKRKNSPIVEGYIEAPEDYSNWTFEWLTEAKRILKQNGSIYIISGWTNLIDILNAANELNLSLLNHIIWKYNFGVYTKKKYVSSHYHILYFTKQKAKPTFNSYCRFAPQEKNQLGKSKLYQDLEDVWIINKEFQPNKTKNINKLPDELIKKIILYSSNEGDIVCDFFLGNFTTAHVANKLGRYIKGFELNKNIFDVQIQQMKEEEFGSELNELKKIEVKIPQNQGKPISENEQLAIHQEYCALIKNTTKKSAIELLCAKYSRGKFGILNIIQKMNNFL